MLDKILYLIAAYKKSVEKLDRLEDKNFMLETDEEAEHISESRFIRELESLAKLALKASSKVYLHTIKSYIAVVYIGVHKSLEGAQEMNDSKFGHWDMAHKSRFIQGEWLDNKDGTWSAISNEGHYEHTISFIDIME